MFHSRMGIYYPDVVKEKIKNASNGSGASCADLGYMWRSIAGQIEANDKISMRQCYKFAIYWLEKAVSLGDGPAAAKLAEFYSDEISTGIDEEMDSLSKQLEYEKKAFELLEESSPTSLNFWILTQYFKTGAGTEKDDDKAREAYKKYLDCCKQEGVSPREFESIATTNDKVETNDICKKSKIDEQEKMFHHCMGTYYPNHIKKKLDEANKGSGAACSEFGRMWISIGEKVDWNEKIWNKKRARLQCFKFAVDWFEKGVILGDGECAANLAWIYSDGFIAGHHEGMSSLAKKLEYEKKAFDLLLKNQPTSQKLLMLTEYYKTGKGTKKDDAKAREIYKKYLDYCKEEKSHIMEYEEI